MEIIGQHQENIYDVFTEPCMAKIKNRMLFIKKIEAEQPNDRTKFVLYETARFRLDFLTYSHFLEYEDINKKTKRIFINPNYRQRFYINWALKKFDVQKQELRIEAYKYIIGAIIGLAIGMLTN